MPYLSFNDDLLITQNPAKALYITYLIFLSLRYQLYYGLIFRHPFTNKHYTLLKISHGLFSDYILIYVYVLSINAPIQPNAVKLNKKTYAF